MKSFIYPKMASNALIQALWRLILVGNLALSLGLVAQDVPAAAAKSGTIATVKPSAPWLGFEVQRADAAVRAQLPKLPKGVGFVISQIDPQGPAHQAGLRAFDILWKWNDQWLINEAQLATLLDLQKAGDRVVLTVYRAGKEQAHEVTLGQSPRRPGAAVRSKLQGPMLMARAASPQTAQRDVNARTARLEDAQAILEMEKRDDGIWLSIVDTQGVTIYDGPYSSSAKSSIPLAWHDRLDALQRSLQKPQNTPRSIAPPSPNSNRPEAAMPQADPFRAP
jgi:hypothetical protein